MDGDLAIDGTRVQRGTLAVLEAGRAARLRAHTAGHAIVIGGASLDGRRFIWWWNLVSPSSERSARTAEDWASQRFGPIPGETEYIPLPEKRADH